jgi:lysozyme
LRPLRSRTPSPRPSPEAVPEAAPVEAGVEVPAETPPAPTPWYIGGDPALESAPAEPVAPSPFPETAFPEAPFPTVPFPDSGAPLEAGPNPFALAPEPAPAVPVQSSPFDAAPQRPGFEMPVFGEPARTAPAADPWPAITATSEPRTDGELLILNPSFDTDALASPRLVWPQGEQQGDETSPLFEDDGSLRLAPGNILRHEAFEEAVPARIPWGELAGYGLMGGLGLVSFGMSMAAFRRASEDSTGTDGTILMAIVLAVIGAACVGVSAYNLYRRWGRAEEE